MQKLRWFPDVPELLLWIIAVVFTRQPNLDYLYSRIFSVEGANKNGFAGHLQGIESR
jgi:hypothetical protein